MDVRIGRMFRLKRRKERLIISKIFLECLSLYFEYYSFSATVCGVRCQVCQQTVSSGHKRLEQLEAQHARFKTKKDSLGDGIEALKFPRFLFLR